MRFPLSWLCDYVNFDGRVEDLALRLGTSGFEVEDVSAWGAPDVGNSHGAFVIGRVARIEQHPNADRLRLCQVDVGEANERQIVCGASNFAVSDTVVVALPGAQLPGAVTPLTEAKLRGEISRGMMLSERELGLSDDHDGIIVLPHDDALEPGSLLGDHMALAETVLDITVESNRGDCLSIYGMAREIAVLFDLGLADLPGVVPKGGAGRTEDLVAVGIEAPDLCSRFTARGFVDVTVGKSPLRVRQRLAAAGFRSISNVVDATNYVMHELGNPLHVYDADRIAGGQLSARLAHAGEAVRTLDDRERVLTDDMLVIADDQAPVGIAGIMGGLASEVTPSTSRVVLEAASFDRGTIQRTSKALGLRTDSSNRWEKGISPHLAPIASVRAAELICAWSGATMLSDPLDVTAILPARESVESRKTRSSSVLGMTVAAPEIERILTGLGYEPHDVGDRWACTVPWWRWLDATREIDLIEEIGRVFGLEHVPATLPRIAPGIGGLTRDQRLRRLIEDHLAGAGLREVVTLSLVDPGGRMRFGFADANPITLRNPLSSDLSELRVTLLPSLLEVVRRNRAVGQLDVQIFEMGRVHRPGGEEGLAIEEARLGIVLSGLIGGNSWLGEGPPADFGSLAAVVDGLLARLGIRATRIRETQHPLLHPGRAARVVSGDLSLGVIGELHPAVSVDIDLEGPIALADLDVGALASAAPAVRSVVEPSPFPPVRQDIAVVALDSVDAATLIETTRAAGGDLLSDVEVFDVFADEGRLGAGYRSLALHLVFRARDRTLTEEEVSDVRQRIVSELSERHGAELRG